MFGVYKSCQMTRKQSATCIFGRPYSLTRSTYEDIIIFKRKYSEVTRVSVIVLDTNYKSPSLEGHALDGHPSRI